MVLSSESVLWEELSAGGKVTGLLILRTFGEKSNNVKIILMYFHSRAGAALSQVKEPRLSCQQVGLELCILGLHPF